MKKLITVSSVLAVLAGSSAYAKTEGNYFGAYVLRANVEHKYKNPNGTALTAAGKFSDSSNGFGIDYKYAFNFNDFYVAPGLFYEKIGTRAEDQRGLGEPALINNRYGAKLDLGYDINDQFAVYFTNGFTKVRYLVDWTGAAAGAKQGVTPLHYFYGVGAAYHATKNVTLNIEYNTQHISSQTPQSGVTLRSKIDVAKIGVAYHF